MAYSLGGGGHFYEKFREHVVNLPVGSWVTSEDIINQYGVSKSYFYVNVVKLIDEGLLKRGEGREETGGGFTWSNRPTFKRYYRVDPYAASYNPLTGQNEYSKPEPAWVHTSSEPKAVESEGGLKKVTFEIEVDDGAMLTVAVELNGPEEADVFMKIMPRFLKSFTSR